MQGELFINGQDAYTTWGISLDETALSTLMTPAGVKGYIENKGLLDNGKQVVGFTTAGNFRPKIEDREFTLGIHLTAPNETEFFRRYERFCEVLALGRLDIKTKYQPNVVYHCLYLSCAQFSQFMRGMAKFNLRLSEPNPQTRR